MKVRDQQRLLLQVAQRQLSFNMRKICRASWTECGMTIAAVLRDGCWHPMIRLQPMDFQTIRLLRDTLNLCLFPGKVRHLVRFEANGRKHLLQCHSDIWGDFQEIKLPFFPHINYRLEWLGKNTQQQKRKIQIRKALENWRKSCKIGQRYWRHWWKTKPTRSSK